MSRHASRLAVRRAGCAAAVLALVAPLAGAQTIADYSRAQRAMLENAMAQAAARSAGSSASSAPPAAASAPAVQAPLATHAGVALSPPDVQVSGVFASGAGAVAEVLVNGTPYLLASGDRVPGTAWQVQAAAVDRVVLERRGGATDAGAPGAVRVFALPALR